MVRNYKRKTVAYNHADMEKAVSLVTSGEMGYKRAAKLYNLNWGTVRHHVKKRYSRMGAGRPTNLTKSEEAEIATSLKLLSQWGFGLTRADTQEVVGDYIKSIGRDTQFVDGMPGVDWLDCFFKRHPELTLRLPEQLKAARAKSSANKTVYDEWFKLLGYILRDNDLLGKPERIYNVDESGFPLDPKRIKVVTERGISHLFRLIGGSGRENITVQGCARADGLMLPPYILYAAKNLRTKWTENGPEGAKYNANEKGWMDMVCFHDWFCSFFLPSLPPEKPVVMIFDGHASHINISTIKEAVKNHVIILKLPSNTTHVLQPLNVGVYGPAKTKWEKILVNFSRQNLGVPLSKELFPSLLKSLWESEAMRPENVKAGFKACGIMPYDPSQISASHYQSAEIFDRPYQDAPPSTNATPTPTSTISVPSSDVASTSSCATTTNVPSSSTTDFSAPNAPSSSAAVSPPDTPSPSSPCLPLSPRSVHKNSIKNFFLAKLTPMLKKPASGNAVNRQRAVKRQFGESLTSEECIARLLADKEERAAKKAKGNGKGKGKGKRSGNETAAAVPPPPSDDSDAENELPPPHPRQNSDTDSDFSDSDNDPDYVPRPTLKVNRNLFEIDL